MVDAQLPGGSAVNQAEAAEALGCSTATVSRLRSGARLPSLDLMREIRRVLSWGIEAQVAAIDSGRYAIEFAEKMDRRRVRHRMRRAR